MTTGLASGMATGRPRWPTGRDRGQGQGDGQGVGGMATWANVARRKAATKDVWTDMKVTGSGAAMASPKEGDLNAGLPQD
jgi:hypothetical protein